MSTSFQTIVLFDLRTLVTWAESRLLNDLGISGELDFSLSLMRWEGAIGEQLRVISEYTAMQATGSVMLDASTSVVEGVIDDERLDDLFCYLHVGGEKSKWYVLTLDKKGLRPPGAYAENW